MTKKIKLTFKDKAPKNTPIVVLTEKTTSQLVERSGKTLLEIGAGKHKDVDLRKFMRLCRKVIRFAKEHKIKKIAVEFSKTPFQKLKKLGDERVIELMAENFEMANYEFTKFKSKPKNGWSDVEEILVCGKTDTKKKAAFKRGQTVGEYVNIARSIANTPGGSMLPTGLLAEARKAAKGTKVNVSALSEVQMKKLKMNAILAVSQGSDAPAQFIIMEYWGKNANKKDPIVLCGKGITFDSGGLNLKPGTNMLDMHLDMSGGAAVVAAVALAAKLKLKKNIVGLIPAVENMPNGSAYRPGDVIKSMSGKTIEVQHTDAEGRVVLADTLTYAQKKYKPTLLVDVATLTGAAVGALGQHASAIMTPSRKLQEKFEKLGEESGDYLWPLPLWDDYDGEVKGRFGDVSNLGKKPGEGGAIAAGAFLKAFVEKTPWVHIDMAPRMTSKPIDNLAQGAAGEPVRFFLRLFETQ